MTKKIIAALLAVLLILSLPAFASTEENRFGILASLNIMVGYGGGDLGLDRTVTRAEFTKMAIAASKYRNSVASRLSVSPFSDVMYDSWYAPYVYLGALNNVLKGYKDGSFNPGGAVTYEEALTVVLRLLGYDDSEFEYSWPYGQIGVAEKNGLCDNMNSYMGQALNRNQVSYLFYNLLSATPKNGNDDYIKTLDHTILSDIILISSNRETQSVEKGYVYTSQGLYKLTENFDYSLVGLRGDAILNDGKITAFIPTSTNVSVYNVFSSSGENLVLFQNGAIADYKLDKDAALYYETQKTTVGAMLDKLKSGDILELHCDKDWDLDYVVYREGELDGPIVVTDKSWYSGAGLYEGAAVVRDGIISSLDKIQINDVVYYSSKLQNVWAYSKKVTGRYDEALPDKQTISQIKLSGVVYDINSVNAYKALSSSGEFSIGDRVTLLLGRDGKVVDAVHNIAGGESYTVYQVVGNVILVYGNGEIKTLSLSNSDTAYFEGNATTVAGIKSRLDVGYTIDVSRNSDGSVEYVTVSEAELDGPFTVKGSSWMSDSGISSDAAIMRGGEKVSSSAVQRNDIIYYSSTLNVVWAYSDTVTGVYEEALPNQNTPVSITVSGKSYDIEGADAYNALSSNGSVSYGDTITLLLGKDGAVADVISGYDTESEIVGLLVDAGTKKSTNASGGEYSSDYISIVTTDGILRQYETARDYSADRYKNSVVKVTFKDGKASINIIKSNNSIYGKYSYLSKKLGSYTLQAGAEILDIVLPTGTEQALYKKIYPQRLDGITFSDKDILYAETSSDGTITRLILNDVTGDAYSYGIVTQASGSAKTVTGSYTYFDGTSKLTANTRGSLFSVYAGEPVRIKNSASGVAAMSALSKYGTVSSITSSSVNVGSVNYKLSDEVCVYVNTEGYEYQAKTISELSDNALAYTITAYYDRSESVGGRVRVLVAKHK